MGKVVMTRVDARLIHGQVAARWTNHLNATKIVVIDDDTAKDKLLIELFRVAAPMGTNVRVYSIDQGIAAWQKDEFGAGKIIVIFKTVDTAALAYEKGFHFKSVNIGQSPKREDRKNVYNSVHLSADELLKLKELTERGVDVYFHSTPDDRKASFSEIAAKM